jgi:hypothetical protein
MNERNDNEKKAPSELLVGSVTFVVFIIFMSMWMYFAT